MTGDAERLLRAAKSKLDELQKHAQDYTTSSTADPVRISVFHYRIAGGAEIVDALEEEARAIATEKS